MNIYTSGSGTVHEGAWSPATNEWAAACGAHPDNSATVNRAMPVTCQRCITIKRKAFGLEDERN